MNRRRIFLAVAACFALLCAREYAVRFMHEEPDSPRPMFSYWVHVAEKSDWVYWRYYDKHGHLMYLDIPRNQVLVITSSSHDWSQVSSWRSLRADRSEFECEWGRITVLAKADNLTVVTGPSREIALTLIPNAAAILRTAAQVPPESLDIRTELSKVLRDDDVATLQAFLDESGI